MRTFLLLCLFSFFTFSTAYAQYPTNGLVAQYGFDNGNLLVDGANGQNFTQTGTSLVEINGRFGTPATSAITLNGDYLTRPDIDFPVDALGMEEYETLSFWVKTTTNDSELRVIIDDSNRSTFANSEWAGNYIYLQDGKIGVMAGVQYRQSSNYWYKTGGAQTTEFVSDGAWHHVAMRIGSYLSYSTYGMYISTAISVFIDGELSVNGGFSQSGASFSLNASHDTVGNITVGNNRSNSLAANNKYFDTVDDILFYNRLLSETEIYDIANYNFCYPPDPSLLTATSITETEMTINISDSGIYDIAYHKESENFSNAIIVPGVTNGTVTLNGLDVFTKYNFYMRKQCVINNNNNTDWSAPIAFTTKRAFGILYVDANANGNNNGISWANAYTNLESALVETLHNEQIWIAKGTYKPHASYRGTSFTITKNNVHLYGGFAGTETQLSDRVFGTNETILSGDLLGNDDNNITYANATRDDNSYTVLNILEDDIVLDRLTITGGHANGADGSPTESRYGGGIHKNIFTRNLTFTNCKVIKNVAKEGGGAMSIGFNTSGGTSSLTINNCEFSDNVSALGGAIYSANIGNSTTTCIISNSLFSKNKVMDTNGGGTGYAGSSMWLRSYGNGSTLISNIINCTFVDNVDLGEANGMTNTNRTTVALTQNSGTSHAATISNSIFWSNKAATGVVANPIGGFEESSLAWINITNSIDEKNFNGVSLSGSSANNSAANPLFSNVGNGYGLSANSPAIDSGDNSTVVGAADLLGNERIFNSTVDRGAYEYGAPVLGIPSFTSFSDFTMYPNPTTSLLQIKSNETINLVEIFSIDGKQVLTSKDTQLDVSHLTSGMYLVKITSDTGKIGIKKLMKQ